MKDASHIVDIQFILILYGLILYTVVFLTMMVIGLLWLDT